ncbi:MAG TPA: hypothetical protein VIS74_00395, partial [Chthoniobacterales bacterium]
PTPMRAVRTLAVNNFKNTTWLPRVDVLLADTLVKQLQQDGTYTIAGDNVADAILNCTLTRAEDRSIRSVTTNVLATSEFALLLVVSYEVQDRVTGAVLLSGTARGETTYYPTGDLTTDRRQAVSVAAERLSSNLSVQITEGW